MAVFEGSRYLKTYLYEFKTDTPQLKIRKTAKMNLIKSNTYIVLPGDRIDSIAYKLYGNAQMWWAIMDANPRYFCETEIKVGDILIIPPYNEVMKYAL